jgi:hypothetical protein
MEKKYEFRDLNATDVFPIASLINKIGYKKFKSLIQSDDMKELIKGNEGNEEAIGLSVIMEVVGIILDNISSCQNEIFDILANVSNLNRKQVEKLSPAEFFEMVIDFVQKPEFGDFFKVVSKLLK